MQSASDPIVSCPTKGSYHTIESGNTGSPMEEERTFFSQVREAKEQSHGFCDFCLIFFSLLISSIIWSLFMAIIITLPLAMIVIGAVNFHDCHKEPMIPVFNIVAGSLLTINNILVLIYRCKAYGSSERSAGPTALRWISAILKIFLFVWFFAGCYWVYHIERPQIDGECNLLLFSFSFWLVSAVFLLFGTIAVASAVGFCIAMICW